MEGYTKSIRADGNEEWTIDNLEDVLAQTAAEENIVDDNAPQLSAEEIQQWEDSQYSRDRKTQYNLLNQDEMRYDDLVNSTTTWQDTIASIKATHPKP